MRTGVFAAAAATVVVTVALGAGKDSGYDLAIYSLLTLVLVAGGLLILRGHPGHGSGRLFCGLGGWLAVTELADSYGYHRTLPGDQYAQWLTSWSWVGEMTFWALILMTFPDGRTLGGRWRWVPRVLLAGAVGAAAGYGLGTDEQAENFTAGVNPLALHGWPTATLFNVAMPLVLVATAAGVASLVLRLRRSAGVEREQLKGFTAAAAFVLAVTPFAVVFWNATAIAQVLMGVAFLTLPVAASVAILRYRLYDIDVVINRALVYAALTATLVAAYLVTVLLAQLVLPSRSDLGIAVSTLAAAAAFSPARARIQAAVDRRFFRRRFDAQRTLAAFGARARDEVDLDTLTGELRGVVAETLQPAHLSLWLRERA